MLLFNSIALLTLALVSLRRHYELAVNACNGNGHNTTQGYNDAKMLLDALQRSLDTLESSIGYHDLLAGTHGKVTVLDKLHLLIEAVDDLLEVRHLMVCDMRYF